MKRIIITVIGILALVALTYGTIKFLEENKPKVEKKEAQVMVPLVEVVPAKRGVIQFSLESEGLVFARRETVLSAQVGGRVTHVHPNFEVGGTFAEGELIAQLDQVDYQTAVAQAEATLEDAKLVLAQEEARGIQAKRDWEKIGGGRTPSDLALRIPYLKSAKARVTSAQALLNKAIEDLGRTRIMAPFGCRVRATSLDLGAVVAPGARLGLLYDPEQYLVRLPFSLDDFAQLPEEAEGYLTTTIAGTTHRWETEVLWSEGDIDRTTLSAYLVVRILPNDEAEERFRLPSPGLFVQAEIKGSQLDEVIPVPRRAVRGRDQVFVMNEEDQLEVRSLKIIRSSGEYLYVREGLTDGERIITTKIELPVVGMKLAVSDGEGH